MAAASTVAKAAIETHEDEGPGGGLGEADEIGDGSCGGGDAVLSTGIHISIQTLAAVFI